MEELNNYKAYLCWLLLQSVYILSNFRIDSNYIQLCIVQVLLHIYIIYAYGIYHTIIESVDSISKDERGFPLTQYITNGRISRGGYTFTHFKHDHRVTVFYG